MMMEKEAKNGAVCDDGQVADRVRLEDVLHGRLKTM